MTCSQLSSTISVSRSRSRATRPGSGSSETTLRPSADAMAVDTNLVSARGAKSTKQTPSRSPGRMRSATASATAVLPMPPGPTMVTRRFSASLCVSVSMASERPNNCTVDSAWRRLRRLTRDGRLCDGGRHLADKGIATSGNVGDIASAVLAVTQRFAQCGDLCAQGYVLDEGVWPCPRTERLLADRLPRLLEQRDQQITCAVPDAYRRFTLEQELARREQAKRTKREPGLMRRFVDHPAPFSCLARSRRSSTAKGSASGDCAPFGEERAIGTVRAQDRHHIVLGGLVPAPPFGLP